MSSNDTVRVSTSRLPVGSCWGHAIVDGDGRLLLAAGEPFSAPIKDRLNDRGVAEVFLHPDDAVMLACGDDPPSVSPAVSPEVSSSATKPATNGASFLASPSSQPSLQETVAQIKVQAAALAASVPQQISITGPPVSQRQVSHGTTPYDPQQTQRLAEQFSATTQLISKIAQQVATGSPTDDRPLKSAAENYVADLIADTDSALASSSQIAPSPAITEKGIRLALLGMSMAIEMNWDEANVREVGHCGLIHDLGMFRLDKRLQDPQAEVSADDWEEIASHPLHTLDILKSMKSISLAVRLAASQVHENPDGTGYPSGLTAEKIHPYAAILHVADVYITLTADMHGRRAFLSYDVMVYLLTQVKLKRIDEKATRALLQVISLFPIGSHVRLSDGSEAQVIRRNAKHYTAPIVQRVGANRKADPESAHASIIDLAETKMRVMSPLVPPDRKEDRLDESLMSQVLWNRVSTKTPPPA